MIIIPSNASAVAPVSYMSIGVGVSSAGVSWTHDLGSVSNGYLIVYVMCGGGGGNTGTVNIGGVNVPQIAPYLSWSDGGGYMFTAYALATGSLSGSKTITLSSGLQSGEMSAQSAFYANVGTVTVGSAGVNSGAWSSPVTVPEKGYASNGFGSRVPSINLAGGQLLWEAGGVAERNYLAVQQSAVSTTFTADDNGRGYGNVRVVMNPMM